MTITPQDVYNEKRNQDQCGRAVNNATTKLASLVADELKGIRDALKKHDANTVDRITTVARAHMWIKELEDTLRSAREEKK